MAKTFCARMSYSECEYSLAWPCSLSIEKAKICHLIMWMLVINIDGTDPDFYGRIRELEFVSMEANTVARTIGRAQILVAHDAAPWPPNERPFFPSRQRHTWRVQSLTRGWSHGPVCAANSEGRDAEARQGHSPLVYFTFVSSKRQDEACDDCRCHCNAGRRLYQGTC